MSKGLINKNTTQAILIGVDTYKSNDFVNAEPIKNNIKKLADLLQDEKILGLSPDHLLIFNQNETANEIIENISDFLKYDKPETVFFYFSGHGVNLIGDDYYLATHDTTIKRINKTAIAWHEIKKILEKDCSFIQKRFYILDSCYSGAAELGLYNEEISEKGSALITAASESEKSYFETNETYTFFTQALIETLENGVDDLKKELLDVNTLHETIQFKLSNSKHPFKPKIKKTDNIDKAFFFKNRKFSEKKLEQYFLKTIQEYRDSIENGVPSNLFRDSFNSLKKEILKLDRPEKSIDEWNKVNYMADFYAPMLNKLKKELDTAYKVTIEVQKKQLQELNKKIETNSPEVLGSAVVSLMEEIERFLKGHKKTSDIQKEFFFLDTLRKKYPNFQNISAIFIFLKQQILKLPVSEKTELLSNAEVNKIKITATDGIRWITNKAGEYTDNRDNKTYRITKIGEQIWFAQNLAYQAKELNYVSFNIDKENVAKHGFIYTWDTALKAVPEGWHIPTKEEYEVLIRQIGNTTSEIYRKFSDIMGLFDLQLRGWYGLDKQVKDIDTIAAFWTGTAYSKIAAYTFYVSSKNKEVSLPTFNRNVGMSVRLIKD